MGVTKPKSKYKVVIDGPGIKVTRYIRNEQTLVALLRVLLRSAGVTDGFAQGIAAADEKEFSGD